MQRTEGNINNIKKYINKYPNWDDFIIERHKMYINELISSNFNMLKLSYKIGMSKQTLLSIFLRIESQFEIYEYDQKELQRRILLKKQNILSKLNPNTGNNKKDEAIIQQISDYYDHLNLLPEYLLIPVKYLLQGKTIDEIINIIHKNKKYLLSSIIGTSKPRRPSEMGIKKLIQKQLKEKEV